MDAGVARTAALAAHGKAWLRDPSGPAPELTSASPLFRDVRALSFVASAAPSLAPAGAPAPESADPPRERVVATGTRAWYQELRGRGARDLGMLHCHREMSLDFGTPLELVATQPDGIRVELDAGAEAWFAAGSAGTLVVRAMPGLPVNRNAPAGFGEAARRLRSELAEISEYVRRAGAGAWADEVFGPAAALLDADAPAEPAPGILPARGYSPAAHRLAAAAASAWVFGRDAALHAELPDGVASTLRLNGLYFAVFEAVAAAVNHPDGDASGTG